MYKKYKDKGFEILGFPCNQFALQEPGTNEEIKNFCDTTILPIEDPSYFIFGGKALRYANKISFSKPNR